MVNSKLLDEFYDDLFCDWCQNVTEHNVQKIDEENNGEFIGYYKECLVCENVEDTENIYKEEIRHE